MEIQKPYISGIEYKNSSEELKDAEEEKNKKKEESSKIMNNFEKWMIEQNGNDELNKKMNVSSNEKSSSENEIDLLKIRIENIEKKLSMLMKNIPKKKSKKYKKGKKGKKGKKSKKG